MLHGLFTNGRRYLFRALHYTDRFHVCDYDSTRSTFFTRLFQCSVTCGTGTVVRNVTCSHPDERNCPQHLRPPETEICFLPSCPTEEQNDISTTNTDSSKYKWRKGAWSDVSARLAFISAFPVWGHPLYSHFKISFF